MDEAADVLPALFEVEHHIADALAGAVIGVAAAAAASKTGKSERIDQLGRVGAGPGGEQRRMLEQPDAFARAAVADRGGALLHEGERLLVGHRRFADAPFDVVGMSIARARWSAGGRGQAALRERRRSA